MIAGVQRTMSYLEILFKKQLSDERIKVVSFDLFDTLVFRKTFEPSEVFNLMPLPIEVNEIISRNDLFLYKRIKAENRAREAFAHEIEDITLETIYNHFELPGSLQKELISCELEIENRTLFANKQTDRWLELAKKSGKKVIIASDMYLNTSEVEKNVLPKLDNHHCIDQVYMSGEIGKLKRTGSLFDYIIEQEGVDASEIFHLGDNFLSDVIVPSSKKIHTLHYGLSSNVKKIFDFEKIFLENKLNELQSVRHLAVLNRDENYTYSEKVFFEIGSYVFGPLMWGFAHWLFELAISNKLKQINCVMREGRIFKRVLEYIKELKPEYTAISVNIIYASRASLFFPFLHEEFDDKHLIYNKITVAEFYRLLKVPIQDQIIEINSHENYYKAANIELDTGELLSERIRQDITKRRNEIKQSSQKQHDLLLKYLQQIEYDSASIMVDFGGGGSILNAFSILLHDKKPHLNVLFYKHEKALQLSEKIVAFLPFYKKSKQYNHTLLKLAPVIETLFNGDELTTTSYIEQKDEVVAVKSGMPLNISSKISAFDRGIESFIATANSYSPHTLYTGLEDRVALGEILNRFLKVPMEDEAAVIGELPFELNHAATSVTQYSNVESQARFGELGVEKYLFNVLTSNNYLWAHTLWPELEVSKYNDSILQMIYGVDTDINANKKEISTLKTKIIESGVTELSIYGAGQFAIEMFPILIDLGIVVNGYVDAKAYSRNISFCGKKVQTPEESILNGETTFLIASAAFAKSMKNKILSVADENDINVNVIALEDR